MLEGGDGSTLSLDFTAMSGLDSRFTFSRASTATFINSSGLVESASTNVPRFDHDPSTLAPRGLLVEGQATNLITNSQNWNSTGWSGASGVTVSETGSGSPQGLANSQVITCVNSAASGASFWQRANTTIAGSTAYTWSVFLKSGGPIDAVLFCRTNSFSSNSQLRINLTVTPPTVSVVSGSSYGFTSVLAPTVQDYGNGWYRITTGGTTQAGDNAMWIGFQNADAVPASGTNTITGFGLQLETGSGASSYIPTGASQATRAVDEATMPVSSIAFNQTAGTIYSDLEVRLKAFNTFSVINTFNTSGSGSAQRCWHFGRFNRSSSVGSRVLGLAFISGGTAGISSGNYVYNSGNGGRVKYATSLDTSVSSVVFVIAGGSPQSVTASAFTLTTAATLALNSNSDLAATELGSMWIARLAYWPSALPTATMQALTQ